MKNGNCSHCNNTLVIQRKYSGENLCPECFQKNIEKIVYKTISKYKMLKPKDKIGDGFKDTVVLNLPEQTKLEEGSLIEISYEYWYDEKRKVKNSILNIIRYFTLFILVGNFILSIVKFGGILFWI